MSDQKHSRDKEMDALLSSFRKLEPSQAQIDSWKNAVNSANSKKRTRFFQFRFVAVSQIAAALMIGFVIGATTFSMKTKPSTNVSENDEPSATIEHIYAKAD